MKTINPDMQQLPAILAGLPTGTPIVMLNLLRFRDVAEYKGVPADYSGREAYRRYSEFTLPRLAEIGAAVIFLGAAKGALIAPDYFEATRHRTAALEDSRLIATVASSAL